MIPISMDRHSSSSQTSCSQFLQNDLQSSLARLSSSPPLDFDTPLDDVAMQALTGEQHPDAEPAPQFSFSLIPSAQEPSDSSHPPQPTSHSRSLFLPAELTLSHDDSTLATNYHPLIN